MENGNTWKGSEGGREGGVGAKGLGLHGARRSERTTNECIFNSKRLLMRVYER